MRKTIALWSSHFGLAAWLAAGAVAGAGPAGAMAAARHDEGTSRIAPMKQLYIGDVVQNREQLEPYVGKHAVERIVGALRQRVYLLNYEQLGINYGENVEYQLRREQVILCPQTAAFLYSQFTPATVSYAPGSRPVLEQVVADATGGCTTSQDKVLRLMRFCRDLYRRDRVNDYSKYIYGGTEEQLIEKGERLCGCLGRLFVALCEVAGIPARIVMHDIGGHITAEAYVDGHWGYIDPRCGVYFLKPDGAMASVWELWQDPRLMRGQSDEVKADVRAMLDDVGRQQGRQLDIMVRVPFRDAVELGLDWKTWMEEKLVDTVVVTHLRPTDAFDIPVEDFVAAGKKTGGKIYGGTWLALGFVTTDSEPSDDGKKRRRYDKPKTKEMYYSQALLFHRAGVDGIQVAMSGDAWLRRPWLNDLADPAKIEFADKHYMADPRPYLPVKFAAPTSARDVCNRLILMRIGDDIPKARAAGHDVDATLVFYSRALKPGEKLEVFINTEGPLTIDGASPDERARAGEALVDLRKQKREEFIFDREWWKRGERKVSIDANWLKLGTNTIRFVYSTQDPKTAEELSISWVDLLLKYRRGGATRTSKRNAKAQRSTTPPTGEREDAEGKIGAGTGKGEQR